MHLCVQWSTKGWSIRLKPKFFTIWPSASVIKVFGQMWKCSFGHLLNLKSCSLKNIFQDPCNWVFFFFDGFFWMILSCIYVEVTIYISSLHECFSSDKMQLQRISVIASRIYCLIYYQLFFMQSFFKELL